MTINHIVRITADFFALLSLGLGAEASPLVNILEMLGFKGRAIASKTLPFQPYL